MASPAQFKSDPPVPTGDAVTKLRHKLDVAKEQLWRLGQANRALELEVTQRRLAEDLARRQSDMLIHSLGLLASEPDLDRLLGYTLKATVDQLGGVGGTLWFPDRTSGTARLHLEYLDGRIIPASESRHPAVQQPPPIGGGPMSTFPDDRAETYLLSYEVSGMPEPNRAYIMSLGVRALLTVPMLLGNDTVGWICIRSGRVDSREFESKIRVAEALAGQATLAMQMAKLSDQARQAGILEERNRIAREIHDTLAQGFTGVVLNLEAAIRALDRDSAPAAREHIDHARQLAHSGLQEARQSVGALRPEAAGTMDLVAALETLLKRLEETETVTARCAVQGTPAPLCRAIGVELTRIVQESITNILKHARARCVHIALVFGDKDVVVSVADDGAGFDPEDAHDGFGLLGMRERAARIGAQLIVRSAPGRGTTVSAQVTLAQPVSDRGLRR